MLDEDGAPMADRLNFFSGYGHGNDEIENNLTRAFVLCLRGSPIFRVLFLERALRDSPFQDLRDSVPTSFRVQVAEAQLQPARRAFGLALIDGEGGSSPPPSLPPPRADSIPDAVVYFGDELVVVVEAKRDGNPLDWAQLAGHMAKARPVEEGLDIERAHAQVPWQDVTVIADRSLRLLGGEGSHGLESALLSDFLDYMEDHQPNLVPCRHLPAEAGDPRVGRRLARLLESFRRGVAAWHRGFAYKVDLNGSPRSAASLFLRVEEVEGVDAVVLNAFAGDTVAQSRTLWATDVGSKVELIRSKKPSQLKLGIYPYAKFAFAGSGLARAWTDRSITEIATSLSAPTMARWLKRQPRSQWPQVLAELESAGLMNQDGRRQFAQHFDESQRATADVSIAVELKFWLPYPDAQALDRAGRLEAVLQEAANLLVTTLP